MTGGQDKGFCLSYYKLSYRRKFVRTLWLMVFAMVLTVAWGLLSEVNDARVWGLILAVVVICCWQARYCFFKWKSESSES